MSSRLRVIVPVALAAICVLIFAWILFGAVLGGREDGAQISNEAVVSQAQRDEGESIAPEVESRAVDSYAAYESKDPFRQLLAPAEEETVAEEATGPTVDDNGEDRRQQRDGDDGRDGRGPAGRDSDGDGIPDRRENRLGTDPTSPDTDDVGAPDRRTGDRPDRRDRAEDRRPGGNGLFESGGVPN